MKNWILRWLGLTQPSNTNEAPYGGLPLRSRGGSARPLIEGVNRHFFEIITATNGKIVVYNKQQFNPNGPDSCDMEVYLVPEGSNLMDTVTTAIVSANLK
jgi:hypothetical protein